MRGGAKAGVPGEPASPEHALHESSAIPNDLDLVLMRGQAYCSMPADLRGAKKEGF